MHSKFNDYFYIHTFFSGTGSVYFESMETKMVDAV